MTKPRVVVHPRLHAVLSCANSLNTITAATIRRAVPMRVNVHANLSRVNIGARARWSVAALHL